MKRKIIISVLIAALLILAASVFAFAAENTDGGPVAEAKFGSPEALDGVLDSGWDGAKSYKSEKHASFDPTEIEAEWKVMYDNTNLYFYVDVTDSTVIREFGYNYHTQPNAGCAWSEEDRYCVLVKWDDFIADPDRYINQAFDKRFSAAASKIRIRNLR